MMLFLICLLALFSLIEPSGMAWLVIRGLAFLAVGFVYAQRQRQPDLPTLAVALAIFSAGGYRALDYVLAALVFGTFCKAIASRRNWWALAATATGICGAAAFALHNYLPPEVPLLLPFYNRNHYAIFAETFLPLLVWQAVRQRSVSGAVGAVVLVGASLAGASRAGIVILGVELLVLAWRLGGRKALGPALLGAAALASVFVLLSDPGRIRQPLEGDHRLEIWQSSLHMISARPLTGWGPNEFARIYPAYALFDNGQQVGNAHNDWLEWATEFGLAAPIGLALLLGLYARKVQRQPWAWGILFGALHALVDFGWHLPGLMLFTVAFAGAVVGHVKEPTNP